MLGAFGLSFALQTLSPAQVTLVAEEIARYKTIRSILKTSRLYRLCAQTDLRGPPTLEPPNTPDAVEFYDPVSQVGVVLIFQGQPLWNEYRFILKGLTLDTSYSIDSSDDRSLSGTYTGQELMTAGIIVPFDSDHLSLIFWIKPAN